MGTGNGLRQQGAAGLAAAAALRETIRSIGTTVSPAAAAASQRVLAPWHETEPYADVQVHRDVAYGPHPRQRLDLFSPAAGPDPAGRPVVVFLHGGGFVAGDKRRAGTAYHDNVALWAVRHGMIGVTVNYRLAPESAWPSGAQDVAAVLAWSQENISAYGGAPDRVHLMGTSAGATHVGSYLAHPELQLPGGAGVASAVLLSGAYDLPSFNHERLRPYLGADAARYAEMSLVPGLVETEVPVLYVIAEFDPADAQQQALTMVNAYFARHRRWPAFVRLRGDNHFTVTNRLNTAFDQLGTHLLAEIHGAAARRGAAEESAAPRPMAQAD